MDPATLGPSLTLCALRSAFVGPINHLLPLVNMLSISCSHMLRLLGKLFHLDHRRGKASGEKVYFKNDLRQGLLTYWS